MEVVHGETAEFGKMLGGGAENNCVKAKKKPGAVYKFANIIGRFWQTQTPDFLPECARTYRAHGVRIPDGMRQIVNPQLSLTDNLKALFAKKIIEEIERHDLEDMALKWKDFIDPENGAGNIRKMIEYMKDAYHMNEKHDLGADPIGGGAFLDFPKIFTQELILKLADKSPDFIRRVVEAEVAGVEGKLRNIVVLPDGDLEQIDIGMHDWRPEGKFKPATRLVNDLMFAVVKEVLLAANERLGPNGIPTEEIESAPIIPEDKSKSITREAIIRKIAKPLVRDLSAPAFDRYDEKKESFETEARYNFHERMSHRLRRALGWR